MRWFWLLAAIAVVTATAVAQAPPDDITQKQLNMLAAEIQFFNALATQQKAELDTLKARPCSDQSKPLEK